MDVFRDCTGGGRSVRIGTDLVAPKLKDQICLSSMRITKEQYGESIGEALSTYLAHMMISYPISCLVVGRGRITLTTHVPFQWESWIDEVLSRLKEIENGLAKKEEIQEKVVV